MKPTDMKTAALLLCLLPAGISTAQPSDENPEWMRYVEEIAALEETDAGDAEQLFDELSRLSEHPFDLHAITEADLKMLPFLSEIQIQNLMNYIHEYPPPVDAAELQYVETIDRLTFARLRPFVYVGTPVAKQKPERRNFLAAGKQEILLRSDYTLQQKAGYRTDGAGSRYLGEPYYLSLRYGFKNRNVRWGFSGEKDAGEPFWNSRHKGFDHYAFNFCLSRTGILDALHIGDYRLSFGRGLVMNTGFSPGKNAFITDIYRTGKGVSRNVSTNETGFFRGVAATLNFRNMQLTAFASRRKHDANADSLSIYTLRTDGYHRTSNEVAKRQTAVVNTAGAHAQWQNQLLDFGVTFVYYDFGDKQFNPVPQPFNLFYLRKRNHFNAGIHYGVHKKTVSFLGETAQDASGAWATVNHLLLNPVAHVKMTFSYRNYAYNYNALYAKAFSESSTVRNEEGFYTGVRIYLSRLLEVSASADYFRFPWLKDGVNSPSSGMDGLLQCLYQPADNLQLNLKYRYREKEKNTVPETGAHTVVLPYRQQQFRFGADFPYGNFNFKTRAEYHIYNDGQETQTGRLLMQTAGFPAKATRFRIDAGVGWFHTGGWDSRIAVYEKSVLYAFALPNLYGRGLRFHAVARWKITPALTVYLKIADTRYFDRDVIGSGQEEINGQDKTDVSCLLKCRF
jgi:opacity protein-like surface antigen